MIKEFTKSFFIIALMFAWIFSGWPQIGNFPPQIQKAHAAVAFQAVSTIAASTGADITVTLPTHLTDDVFLLQVLVRDVDDTLTISGWTLLRTIDDGSAGRHWWYYLRATSASETNPLVDKDTTTGDTYASVTSYRGAVTSGNPFEVTGSATCTGTSDPFDLLGITTLTANALIIASWNDRDNFSATAAYTPATDPSSLTQVMHNKSTTGADGLTAAGASVKASIGATGNISVNPNKAPDGACGTVFSLKEDAVSVPTVTSDAATSITSSSATLNGNITATGGNDATQHGFAYGTDPTLATVIATSTLGSKTGTGTFSDAISSLSDSTVYYFRAYATNSAGTGYGTIANFTTSAIVYSVSLSGGTISFGSVDFGVSSSTGSGNGYTQTATNDGDDMQLNVKTSITTGGATPWNNAATISLDNYKLEVSTTSGSSFMTLQGTDTYLTASSSMAAGNAETLDFRFTTPSSSSDFAEKTFTITVQASAP